MNERKGAKNIASIQKDILDSLHKGEIESANLVEWLAIDPVILIKNFLTKNNRNKYYSKIVNRVDSLKKKSVTSINEAIGEELLIQTKLNSDEELFDLLAKAKSDSLRNIAAYFIGKDDSLTQKEVFQKIKPFANDSHFGVREIAWLTTRPILQMNLEKGILILEKWSHSKSEFERRFASEISRPRGVWCKHIEELKINPDLALPILEPLFSDPSKYVRDSVGNWLNDAGKTKPDFVKRLVTKLSQESKTKETEYIIKKATRNL
ncbi:MAG: DNA alkylation repair protein [Leptospiraceae bacterium]|nr:DNA alkylation repair protein [Leptospiraceae bacterium]